MAKANDAATPDPPSGFWANVVSVLPKITTPIQLIGLVVIVGAFLAYRAVPQELIPGALIAGVVGGAFVFLGQVFRLTEKNKNLQTPAFLITILIVLSIIAYGFFITSLHYLVPSPRNAPHVRSETPRPLPDDIDFVDADFVPEENPDTRGTLLDIKFTNQGYRSAFVKQLLVDVKQVWHLKHPPASPSAVVGPSALYEVKLDETKVPYAAKVSVSNAVEPGKSDEFHLLVKDVKQWSEVYTVYRLGLELVANGSDHRTRYKNDFLVFFSEYSNKFPTLEEAVAANQLERMPVDHVKKLLAENRSTLREIAGLKDCVMSPALKRFIESAERR